MGDSILVCGAFQPEIDIIYQVLQGAFETTERPLHCLCTGIGNVESAVQLTRYLLQAQQPVSEILFLGSCGAYNFSNQAVGSSIAEPGTVIVAHEFWNVELAVLQGEAKLPSAMKNGIRTKVGSFAAMCAKRYEWPICPVNCPDSISLTRPSKWAIQGNSCPEVENMECFGLASAALSAGIPFAAFLAVTNAVGPEGSQQWLSNFRSMSLSLQASVLDCMRELFPSIPSI